VKEKLEILRPRSRVKRGIFNGLGSMIKIDSGNMDAYDEEKIGNRIKELRNETRFLTKEADEQRTFYQETLSRFTKITKHINKDQEDKNLFIKNYKNNVFKELTQEHNEIHMLQHLNRISYSIDLLTVHLNNIAESILLAKLRIVPKFILAETELNRIIQFVESQGLKIGSNEQVYELTNIQAQINETDIIFRVRAPIFEPTVYQLYHVIPIPINGTRLIVIPNYVAINKYKKSFFNNQCSKVHETFICESEELGVVIKGKECLRKILMNKPPICDSVNLEGREMVLAPEDGHMFIFNALDLPVNKSSNF